MKKFLIILMIATSVYGHDKDGSAEWNPFEWTIASTLAGNYPVVSVIDGGIGAKTVFLTESGTSTFTDYFREGVPLGFGHQWLESPWHISLAGVDIISFDNSDMNFQWAPSDSNSTIVDARFGKSKYGLQLPQQESFLRRVSFRTRTAPWQINFSFDEMIEEEGYNFSLPEDSRNLEFGSSKSRITTLNIQRNFSENQYLSFTHETIRQHRKGIPSLANNYEEFWGDRTSVKSVNQIQDSELMVTLFCNGGDVERD
ncbi:hypothetical protein HN843_06795, partial [bacterium]|nr:hypothetical protein [bacterium]